MATWHNHGLMQLHARLTTEYDRLYLTNGDEDRAARIGAAMEALEAADDALADISPFGGNELARASESYVPAMGAVA